MLGLDSLVRIADRIETAPVSLKLERCLRRRHKEAPCRRCIEACPSQAITEGEPVALDAERCAGCGLCLHICPTEAFLGPGDGGSKLLRVLGSLDEGDVELACDRKADLSLARAKVSYVVKVKPCLASLSLPTLLAAVIQKKTSHRTGLATNIWLNDEPCRTCPIGAVQSEVRRTMAAANRLLAAFGLGARIFTYRGSPELLPRNQRKRPVVQGDIPHYSRRDFFGSLRNQTRRAWVNLAAESLAEDIPPAVEDKLPHQLPSGRRSLTRILYHLGQPAVESIEASGLSLGTVSINRDCTACGLCARLCPSGALTFAGHDRRFTIGFTPVDCLGCTICTLICPSKAASFRPEVDTRSLVAGAPQTLHAGRLGSCRVCGAHCTERHNEPLCFVCQRRQEADRRTDRGNLVASGQIQREITIREHVKLQ